MKNCPNCGAQNADDSRFCTECGKPIPQGGACPHCGASVNDGDVFCRKCGKGLIIPQDEAPNQYEEEEEPKKNLLIPFLACLLLFAMIGGGWWYWDSSNKQVAKTKAISDSLSILRKDSLEKEKARLDSIELYNHFHSSETILKRVKEMYGEDEFFSIEYRQLRKEMDKVAEKSDIDGIYFDDQDYDIWYGGNGGCDGIVSTKFGDVTNISEKTARIQVSNSNDCGEHYNLTLYLIFENNNWFVDDISNPFLGSFKKEIKKFIDEYSHSTMDNRRTSETNNYDWLQGHWVYDTPNGRINVVIEGNHIIQYRNSRSESRNPMYTIENNEIRAMFYDGMMTTYKIDTYNKRIDIGDGNWMHKIE